MSSISDQATLVGNLFRSFQQRYDARNVDLLETHISYVLLDGEHAYKIKKAVKLDFLDFSTLERRHYYCLEELRLNQRYAPHLYLGLVAIGGSVQCPLIETSEPAIEYAVKMREFPQSLLGGNLLASGELHVNHIDQLATTLAAFHNSCQKASANSACGSGDLILQTARDNFREIRVLLTDAADIADLVQIEQWTDAEFSAQAATLGGRKADGFVRECHGDLHLGNLALIDGEMSFFDCIEFNENMRWIDVMSEVAFLVMDLDAHQVPDLAFRFLNAYLQETGDYAGLAVFRFYVVFRAMVRAKIALLRLSQCNGLGKSELMGQYCSYVHLIKRWTQAPYAALVLMHGLSGSGKSRLSQGLLQMTMAIWLRSDVERKRLARLSTKADSHSAIDANLYEISATETTYHRLLFLSQAILRAGYTVIVDAACLQRWQRRLFGDWARAHDVPFAILNVVAPQSVLRERVARRAQNKDDASEADLRVLDHQMETEEPIGDDESGSVLVYDSTQSFDAEDNAASICKLFSRLKKPLERAP